MLHPSAMERTLVRQTYSSVDSPLVICEVSVMSADDSADDGFPHMLQFSQRCDLEYKLAVAREFRDERAFYFPHNVDFRYVVSI